MWQNAYDNWAWLELRGATVNDAFSGVLIGLTSSFIILLIMTGNLYVSLLAIFSISSIILQLMGMI
jgi:hypothetical protein